MAVDPKFITNRQGKDYVLYGGLIATAHDMGLRGVETEIVKLVFADDNKTPLFAMHRATVTMKEGQTYIGYGDASVDNVGRNITPHLIRMSETRAKARALRDATNIGMTAFDEINPDDDGSQPDAPQRQRSSSRAASNGSRQGSNTGSGSSGRQNASQRGSSKDSPGRGDRITREQAGRIQTMSTQLFGSVDDMKREYKLNAKVGDMTGKVADALIRRLERDLENERQDMGEPRGEDVGVGTSQDSDEEDFDDIDIDEIDGVSRGGAVNKQA